MSRLAAGGCECRCRAPAVIGVSLGLLGLAVPVVDLATYGVLSLAVLAIAVLGIVPTVALRLRR